MKKVFLSFDLFTFRWLPYNGGKSYSFAISLLTIGGKYPRSLFSCYYERFYQWSKPSISVNFLFFEVYKQSSETADQYKAV